MRKKLVAGNWKMNGSLASNADLLAALSGAAGTGGFVGVDVAVFAPYPYLFQVQSSLSGSGVLWGAQSLSEHASGAYTGEVSAAMLSEFGCSGVIVGHSERRTLFGESDSQVAAKAQAALNGALMPVICLGETLQERERGETKDVVGRQLRKVLERIGIAGVASSVLAYEPVWAIGTGLSATPGQAQEVHSFLRGVLSGVDPAVASSVRIVYGGSVKASNAAELFSLPDVDGGLVGGASLEAAEFLAICRAARV